MRRSRPVLLPGAAALASLLAGACALPAAPPPPAPPPDGGVRAMDTQRGMTDGDRGMSGNNTGTWGGVQVPNMADAPRLPLPPSRVPGL